MRSTLLSLFLKCEAAGIRCSPRDLGRPQSCTSTDVEITLISIGLTPVPMAWASSSDTRAQMIFRSADRTLSDRRTGVLADSLSTAPPLLAPIRDTSD